MAESVLFNLAGNIICALSLPAFKEVSRLWSVGIELEKLKETVSTIQAVLLDAEEKSYKSHQIKNWLDRLKDAFYDTEDLLGDIFVQARLRDLKSQNKVIKDVRTFFSNSNQLVFRFKMAHRLKKLIMKIGAIKADKPLYLDERLTEMGVEISHGRREQTHSFIRQEEVIGRDDDKREIIRLLMDSNTEENVSIISIVGIGGLGKTTLAQYVYNDETVQKHFQLVMWICVSNTFDIKTTVGIIIASAKKTKVEYLEMDQMQSTLRKEIDGKRYLLVLDDLWNENRDDWLRLKSLLDGGARGSKILITTRTEVVAKAAGTIWPYFIGSLSSNASLELFIRVASEKTQEITESEKTSIGKEIVKKYGGIPLAIRVIGGMLFFRRTMADWLYFKKNELLKFTQRDNDITAILKLSYNHLPSHLKQCFAFCSLFPKDYSIPKSTLISCWISQGFVQLPPSSDLDAEEIANEYFTQLLWRNFFQDVVYDEFGNVIECKMHDLLHDLAYLVAGAEGQNIKEAGPRTRHISYGSNRDLSHELPKLKGRNTKLRTLLPIEDPCARSERSSDELSESTCHKIISDFRCLRFLALHYTNMKVVPNSISELKHLYHLDLSHNKKMERLPNSVKGWQNLVILKLNDCDSLKELPKDIGSLGCLEHLILDGYSNMNHMPRSLGRLTSLRTLTCFIVGDCNSSPKNCARLSDLSGLNKLRGELIIEICGHIKNAAVESKRADIKAKNSLGQLVINWRHIERSGGYKEAELIENHETLLKGLKPHMGLCSFEIVNYKGARFPRWMMEDITQCLPNLVEVGLYKCKNCQFLPPLGLLPHLKRLSLHELSAVRSITCYKDSSAAETPLFLSLSNLHIGDCPNLESLPSTQDLKSLILTNVSEEFLKQSFHLQKLERLSIRRIGYVETLSKGWLQSLSSLEMLWIEGFPNLTSLSLGMQNLSSLVSLFIDDCQVLDLSVDENHNVMQHLESLKRLRKLEISMLPKLTSIPDWLFHLTTLESLKLAKCSNLVSLANRMGDLTSLVELEIIDCPSLKSLPESMSQLKSLRYLRITKCPELEDKCRKDSGEEWHKIAHVSNVSHVLYSWEEMEWESLAQSRGLQEEAMRRTIHKLH